jgi:putative nucleotidyltransferase with HDIG domain
MSYVCACGLHDQIRSIGQVNLLSDVVFRVLNVVKDESCTALDLASEIELDSRLAAKILRLVNSSSYGLQGAITSIPDAAILLGFDEIERIALTVSLATVFAKDRPGMRSLRLFWRHSIAASIAAHVIEQRNLAVFPQLTGAHVAGLLHDIGKVVIALYFPEEQARIDQLVESGCARDEAEREVLDGATHGDIGAWLATDWGLPTAVVESIELHHHPDRASSQQPMVHATHLADCLANQLGCAGSRHLDDAGPHSFSVKVMRFDREVADQIAFHLDRSRFLLSAVATGAMFSSAE